MKTLNTLLIISILLSPLLVIEAEAVEKAWIDSLLSQISKSDQEHNLTIYRRILRKQLAENEDYSATEAEIIRRINKLPEQEKSSQYINFSNSFRDLDRFDKALHYLNVGLRYAKNENSKHNLARTYLSTGDINRLQADFIGATNNYLKALGIFEELDNYKKMVSAYSKISLAYKEMEDFDAAMQNLQKAHEILATHPDDIKLISILAQISNLYKRQRKLDLAEDYAYRSYRLSEEMNFERGILNTKGNLATLLLMRGKYDAAIIQFKELLEADKSKLIITSQFEVKLYNLLCEAYLKKGDLALSKKYGEMAIKLAREKGYQNSLKVAHQNISDMYSQTGDYQKALFHYKTSQDIDDDIAEQSILNTTKELEAKYQTMQKEKEILHLKEQKKISRLQFLTVSIILLLLLVVATFIYFLYRLKSKAHRNLTVEIAEREKTEKLLEEKSKLLRLIIDSIPVHLFLKNSQLKFQMVNQTMKKYYQLEEKDFIDRDLAQLSKKMPLFSQLFTKCDKMDKRTLQKNRVQELLSESIHPQTYEKQWFYTKTIPITIGDENLLLGVAQDVSELKKAQYDLEKINENLEYAVEKRTLELNNTNKKLKAEIAERTKIADQLAESEKQYKTLLHNIPQKVFYKNNQLEYMLCNFSFAEELQLSQAEIIGKSDFDLVTPEAAEILQANDRKVLAEKKTLSFEETVFLNGSEHIYYSVKTPIYHNNNRVIGILGIFWDITEQRRAEKQLLYSERIAGIGELAGGVAHEIKNPLSNISSAIQLLEEDITDDPEILSLINIIHDSVADASSTIRKLIEFGSPRDFLMTKGNITPILENTCKLLRGNFNSSKIKLSIEKKSEIPNTMLDEINLKSAFMNIILNAIQAMPNGGLLTIALQSEQKNITISFKDTGHGIEKRHLQKIYDPFFTTKKDGSGLGMGQIHSVIKLHNGSINIESEIDVGTTLTITLPIV